MDPEILIVHGPQAAPAPLVLDSPHSGRRMPADFGAAASEAALREGEDCFVDALWQPATTRGVPLLAAQFPRTYLDANRHETEVDLELLAEPWPGPWQDSPKARIGKGLVWRTLDAARPIYDRRLSAAEVQRRITRCLHPYQRTLAALLDAAHARHGTVWHINCHSMGANSSVQIEGVEGQPRADFVLGDRDGTSCDPAFTAFVRDHLAALGWRVAVNDPFKGVELVRAWAAPTAGRHSLQLEINKRLYMDETTLQPHDGFATLQQQLLGLVDAVLQTFVPRAQAAAVAR
jgi:N-formylglutamate amidohydrolase